MFIQYDTLIQSSFTPGGNSVETRTPTTNSATATLVLDPFETQPAGQLTCITGCQGTAATLKNFQGSDYPGTWRGDTLGIVLFYSISPVTRLTLDGVFQGDSLSGSAEHYYSTSTHTIYKGHFVAKRLVPLD